MFFLESYTCEYNNGRIREYRPTDRPTDLEQCVATDSTSSSSTETIYWQLYLSPDTDLHLHVRHWVGAVRLDFLHEQVFRAERGEKEATSV